MGVAGEHRIWRLLVAAGGGFGCGVLTMAAVGIVAIYGSMDQRAFNLATLAICVVTLAVGVCTLVQVQVAVAARSAAAAANGGRPPEDRRFAGEAPPELGAGGAGARPDREARDERKVSGGQTWKQQRVPPAQAGKGSATSVGQAANPRFESGGGAGGGTGLASGRGKPAASAGQGGEVAKYGSESASSANVADRTGLQGAGRGELGDAPTWSSPDRERLVDIWQNYFDTGDGRFDAEGLRRKLEASGVAGRVVSDQRIGDRILGVELDDGKVYLLPSFGTTPGDVATWFQNQGQVSRLAGIQRLLQVAEARLRPDGGFELVRQGKVE
jgi:hypothetical protein